MGAGFAGLATAKVLLEAGFEVAVYDKAPDVGGVWSRTRRYPGMRTQNNKSTYCLPGLAMPREFPEWPSGSQVQRYLEGYVRRFALDGALRLRTEVVSAELSPDGSRWTIVVRDADGERDDHAEHLVVANGIFSEPFVPDLRGRADYEAAGGRVLTTADIQEVAGVDGRHVVVLGYGKSACDISVPLSEVAASTTVVARQLLWKLPSRIAGVLNYKYLMLTRLGEALFAYMDPGAAERLLHGPGAPLRRRLMGGLQAVVTRQLRLRHLGLVPRGPLEEIARSTISLATEGFSDAVAERRIVVHRDSEVARLLGGQAGPRVELADGRVLPADLLVCATGYRQAVPFLSRELQSQLVDERGDFRLQHHIAPLSTPQMSFAGYNSSLFSPLSAEVAAVWIAHRLLVGPRAADEETTRRVDARLSWMRARTRGRHAHGTNVIPFSMHVIDEVLDDIGLNLSRSRRILQWLLPIDPTAYRNLMPDLLLRTSTGPLTASR